MGDGKTLVVLVGSTLWRRLEEYEVKKGESNQEGREGKKVGKKEERDRCGHGTGNKRMVLKSWRRAALSLSLPAQARAGSCYLILLSTLLRFIRQLLGALQYAANGGRIVLRVRSDPAFTLFRLPLPISQPSAPG